MADITVHTMSLVRKRDDGSLLAIDGIGFGENEETLFTVTCIKRGNTIFVRDTSVDYETHEATKLFDASLSVREITEEVFSQARERWENARTYQTSV